MSSQFASFKKGTSVATNLVDFVNEAIGIIEKDNQLDTVYMDVRKAFDTVRHDMLLCKLKELGVHSSLLNWIRCYLSDRQQYVKMMGWRSQRYHVTSGVPQGSHLGPLLFLLYFNDVTEVIKSSKCSLYADDLKVYNEITSLRDCVAMQKDLDMLDEWCKENFLMLSVTKCNVMSDEPLRSLRNLDYLLLDRHRTNYGRFEPVNDMSRTFNLFAHLYDDQVTRWQFRTRVRSMILTNDALRRSGFLLTLD